MGDNVERARNYVEANKNTVVPLFRNNYHMMAPLNWINDPNGFIYFRDDYHLFYQYHPYDSKWGPMHWGHSKTKDLVKWEDLPVALAPDENDYDVDGIFSGTSIERDDGNLYVLYTGNYERNGIARQVSFNVSICLYARITCLSSCDSYSNFSSVFTRALHLAIKWAKNLKLFV